MPYPLPPPEPPPIVEIAPESGEQAIVATEATATVRLPGRADIVPIPLPTAPASPLSPLPSQQRFLHQPHRRFVQFPKLIRPQIRSIMRLIQPKA
jgi:hypothetical protein